MPPSPTGFLHLGTARTVLFNYLFSTHEKGKIIFRWEDTDKVRSKTEFEEEILEGLCWLGFDFEQTADLFIRQTDSLGEHTQKLENMWQDGTVFPCFVTPDEIEIQRETAQKNKKNFVFWSPYRDTSKEELEAKIKSGESYTWRIRTPRQKDYVFTDLVRGEVKTNSETIGDFAVARTDGSVLYLLANVFDDDAQNISHIIRGEDHVANTPKQLILWEALDIKPPVYAHIPLVLDSQKRKLSKRRVEPGVAVLIRDFREQGFIPESVINGLAFLGWNPKTTEEIFTLEQLVERFDFTQVNKASAQYDFEKMKWYNQQWLLKISDEVVSLKFLKWAKDYAPDQYEIYSNVEPEKLKSVLRIIKQKSKTFSEFHEEMFYFFQAPEVTNELVFNEKMKVDKELSQKVLTEILELLTSLDESDFTPEILKEVSVKKIGELELKNGQFLWPFRTSLSGREKSAGPFEIGSVLGKDQTIARVQTALNTF